MGQSINGWDFKAVGRVVLLCTTTVWGSGAVHADDFAPQPPGLPQGATNTWQLYLSDQETFDDNLFRIPTGTVGVPGAAFANASQSDLVSVPTLGAQGRWELGRQQIEINLRADQYKFAKNSALDFTAGNAVGFWNWHAGPYLYGQIAVYWDRTLAGFSQTRFSGRDITTSLEELGFARYQLGPHWTLYGQIRGSYLDHGAASQQFDSFHNKAGYSGVEYATDVNNTFSFEYTYIDITFKHEPSFATQALDYSENAFRFLTKYAITEKTAFDGIVGYQRRTYPNSVQPAYSGVVWHAKFLWSPTEKVDVEANAYHELQAYIDAQSNYFIANGETIGPTWKATSKLSFALTENYEKQDYIRSSTTVIAAGARTDKVNTLELSALWQPRDPVSIRVYYRRQKRDSNQANFSFVDNLFNTYVTWRF